MVENTGIANCKVWQGDGACFGNLLILARSKKGDMKNCIESQCAEYC